MTMILLDTNALIFGLTGHERFPQKWRDIWTDSEIQLCVSAASIWEIAIKLSKKYDHFQINPDDVIEISNKLGFLMLDITPELAAQVKNLPWHHKDPFDRLIIAQALQLGIKVMTTDKAFKEYGVEFEG